jgi:hypothetical protein
VRECGERIVELEWVWSVFKSCDGGWWRVGQATSRSEMPLVLVLVQVQVQRRRQKEEMRDKTSGTRCR